MADQDIKYKVSAVNGNGDIVSVYAATDEDRHVAVKMLSDTYGSCEVEEVDQSDAPEGTTPS